MLVAEVCDPEPGMAVLDCCAAPGGKIDPYGGTDGDAARSGRIDIHPIKSS